MRREHIIAKWKMRVTAWRIMTMALIGFWILTLLAGWQFYRAWRQSEVVRANTKWTYIFPTAQNRADPAFRKMWLHYGIGCALVALSLGYAVARVPGFEF